MFFGAYFAVYWLLYAWYVPIAGGNRFVLSLFLPAVWLLVRLLSSRRYEDLALRGRKGPLAWATVVHVVVLGVLVVDLVHIMGVRIVTVLGGS